MEPHQLEAKRNGESSALLTYDSDDLEFLQETSRCRVQRDEG
jgi:hypothetical protein